MDESIKSVIGKIVGVVILIAILVYVIESIIVDNKAASEKTAMFTEITEDNSGLLDVNKQGQMYYYMTDTGIIYFGHSLKYGMNRSSHGAVVISSDGHYMRYNTETNSAEIVE